MAIRPTRLRATVLATALFLIGFGAWPISAEPVHRFRARSLPASAIELEDLRPLPEARWPRSELPAGGVVFVSCTRLWSALPDGSGRRPILQMEGISWPTFSPDARTIAFFVDGRELWLAAADGSAVRRVGDLRLPPFAEARGLAWSPRGTLLAFAVVTPRHDPWVDGSIVWTLDLETGAFATRGVGWQAPFWAGDRVGRATRGSAPDSRFEVARSPRFSEGMSRGGDLTAALARGLVAGLRRSEDGAIEMVLSRRWGRERGPRPVVPPPGFVIPETARLAATREGDLLAVDLVGGQGEPAVGLLEVATETWSVSDEAWEPTLSPSPAVLGPIEARRAANAAASVLRAGPHPGGRAGLMQGRAGERLPFARGGSSVAGTPRRAGGRWVVPGVAYGETADGFGYVDARVRVRALRGRLVAETLGVSELRPISTVDEALGFLEHAAGVETLSIGGLPEGAALDPRWPVSAWTWRGGSHGSVRLDLPGTGRWDGYLEVSFGDVSFSMGCGMPEEIEPTDVGGSPALVGRLDTTHQVIWPATPGDEEAARFSVYGDLPEETVLAIARSMG